LAKVGVLLVVYIFTTLHIWFIVPTTKATYTLYL